MSEAAVFGIILSLLAHGGATREWCRILLRVLYSFLILIILSTAAGAAFTVSETPMAPIGLAGSMAMILIQFKPVRSCLSPLLTIPNQIVLGRPLLALMGRLKTESGEKVTFVQSFLHEKIFLADSLPHLNGLMCYLALLTLCLGSIDPKGFTQPFLMHAPALPVFFDDLLDSILSILLCMFGVGLLMSRKLPQVMQRLGVELPKLTNVAIALTAVVGTFVYDYVGSMFTHGSSSKAASVMSKFNEGTYLDNGAAQTALGQALTTGIEAGIEEELMFRGAVQPALGILPAAFLHGAMHQQFAGAPLWILQIFIWSAAMGVLRRYTNTTTTMIAHGTFNFIQVFLIGFNP